MRKVKGYSIIIFLLAFSFVSFAAKVDIRTNNGEENIRIVLDVFEDKNIDYSSKVDGNDIVITISSLEIDKQITKSIDDHLITSVSIKNDKNNNCVLRIDLSDERPIENIFILPYQKFEDGSSPKLRLVIDLLRNINRKTFEQINNNIEFFRHESTEFGYQFFDVMTIKKGTKIKTEYSQKGETLLQILKRTNSVAGINGGYFISGIAPVGLLKTDDKIISMPLLNRSVIAFDNNYAASFFNPIGSYTIQIGNKTYSAEDWLVASKSTKRFELKVITFASKIKSPKNDVGQTYVLKNGAVSQITKNAYTLSEGETVLFTTYDKATEIEQILKVGDTVNLTQNISGMDVNKYHSIVSAGPKLISDGKRVDLKSNEESFQDDVLKTKAMRSAISITNNGSTVMICTEKKISLYDLTTYLIRYSAIESINLDGGGSSQIGIQDKLFNITNSANTRAISSAIVVQD